jgi:hypothetical protein
MSEFVDVLTSVCYVHSKKETVHTTVQEVPHSDHQSYALFVSMCYKQARL